MANWPLNTDVVQVLPRMPALPDVNGFLNAVMAYMLKSSHGVDGCLTNHHDSPV